MRSRNKRRRTRRIRKNIRKIKRQHQSKLISSIHIKSKQQRKKLIETTTNYHCTQVEEDDKVEVKK